MHGFLQCLKVNVALVSLGHSYFISSPILAFETVWFMILRALLNNVQKHSLPNYVYATWILVLQIYFSVSFSPSQVGVGGFY